MVSLFIISILSLIIGLFLWFIEKRTLYTGIFLAVGIGCISLFLLNLGYEESTVLQIISLALFYGLIPLTLVIGGVLLIFNSKILKTKEGNRFANKLSLILGLYILLLITLIIIYLFYGYKLNSITLILLLQFILNGVYFCSLFFIYLIYSYIYQTLPVKMSVDYIIVLGSGLIGDKVPPLLKSRLDKAIEIYNSKIIENKEVKIIVSGGKGADELVSEASAMKNYLLSQNIKDKSIILEDKSLNTYENILFSKKIIDKSKKSNRCNCVIVTNNFHVFRASVYSRKANLKAQGVGAPTALFFLPNALIREFIAILFIYKWINLLVVLFFLSLGIISFLPF
ncbi:MAG: YdcF family protein [Clostridium sp.]|uniref:YdcF family protein n=1 Tax=Clostridium sp. TaxID=1506 RepID=UPI003065BD55